MNANNVNALGVHNPKNKGEMKRNFVLLLVFGAVLLTVAYYRRAVHVPNAVAVTLQHNRRQSFVRYIPSTWEKDWSEWVQHHHAFNDAVCPRLLSQPQKVAEYLNRLDQVYATDTQNADPIMSKLVYRNYEDGTVYAKYIEPLVGLLRHPLLCSNLTFYKEHKGFLLLDQSTRFSALYMDLGASTWNAGAGGPSQSWIYEQYRERGFSFSSLMMWEANPVDHAALLREIPLEVLPIYQYYNVPVAMDSGGEWSAFRALKAKRNVDYTVLKIDIDNPALERQLVDHLLSDSTLTDLVDEFFFEHHTFTQPMHLSWRTTMGDDSLWESYRIFAALRNKGVRAHSWV